MHTHQILDIHCADNLLQMHAMGVHQERHTKVCERQCHFILFCHCGDMQDASERAL